MSKEVFDVHPKGILSKVVKANGMLYLSGAVGIDPATGKVPGPDIASQTRQTLENIKSTLEAHGSSMDKVVKSLVFITDINDFAGMNEVYVTFFKKDPPARSTVGISALALPGLVVEIEVIALP